MRDLGLVDGDFDVERIRVVDDLDGLQGEVPREQRGTIVHIVDIDNDIGVERDVILIVSLNDEFPRGRRFVVEGTSKAEVARGRVEREVVDVLLRVGRRERVVRRETRRERLQLEEIPVDLVLFELHAVGVLLELAEVLLGRLTVGSIRANDDLEDARVLWKDDL